MVRFNLSHVQAMALASNLVNALEQGGQDTAEVLPPYDYCREFTHILAEGLGVNQAIIFKGLGICCGRGPRRGQNQGGIPQPVPGPRHPTDMQPTQATRQPIQQPILPTPLGFKHNQGHKILACYIHIHLNAPNPFVEGMLELEGPMYCSKIHAAAVNDVNIPIPHIDADTLQLHQGDYPDHTQVDKALGELGDHLLIAKVNRYCHLECKRQGFQESITRLEDQLFTMDIKRQMCISRLEEARMMVRVQGEMQRNWQAYQLSP
jgi:hypothetical protein